MEWYKVTSHADWRNFADVRDSFRDADVYCDCVVFDIKGNDYRLITIILYPVRHVYVRYVLTHAEYDKGKMRERGLSVDHTTIFRWVQRYAPELEKR